MDSNCTAFPQLNNSQLGDALSLFIDFKSAVTGYNHPMATISLVPCPACRNDVSPQAPSCPKCGQPLGNAAFNQNGQPGLGAVNDSGRGSLSTLPAELRGFNWGALLLAPIWSIFNSTWLGLLSLAPYVGLLMCIVLGFKGNEWAWQNRRWDSIEQFYKDQQDWGFRALVVYCILLALGVLAFLAVVMHMR